MTPRRYAATTLPALAAQVRAGQVRVSHEAVVARDDSEDSEYEALMQAADVSADLVAGLPDGQRRRVVVVTEETAGELVATARVLCVHADAADDADPDDDLGWYATQELPELLSGL